MITQKNVYVLTTNVRGLKLQEIEKSVGKGIYFYKHKVEKGIKKLIEYIKVPNFVGVKENIYY